MLGESTSKGKVTYSSKEGGKQHQKVIGRILEEHWCMHGEHRFSMQELYSAAFQEHEENVIRGMK